MISFLGKSEKVQFLIKKCYKMKMRIFGENPASSLFSIHRPLTTCQVLEKSNEQIPRKVCYGRTNERDWIYRTPFGEAPGSKILDRFRGEGKK